MEESVSQRDREQAAWYLWSLAKGRLCPVTEASAQEIKKRRRVRKRQEGREQEKRRKEGRQGGREGRDRKKRVHEPQREVPRG